MSTNSLTQILFRHKKKEEKPAFCDKINEPGEHYVKWKKPDTERQILYGATYLWNVNKRQQKVKLIKTVEWCLPGAVGMGNREMLVKGYEFSIIR